MWMHYVARELIRRRRQAAAVVAGLAVAVAVVVIANSVGSGLKSAQAHALASLSGVGTAVTVTHPVQTPPSAAPRFTFAPQAGSAAGGVTSLAQSQLTVAKGLGTVPAGQVATVAGLHRVTKADGVLLLDNYDFSGLIPSLTGAPASGDGGIAGNAEGASGSSFNVDSFTVAGIDTARSGGVASSLAVTSGRGFTAADATRRVALVDALYAHENQISVGSPVNIGGVDIPVVGLVSGGNGRASLAQSYLPLPVAQALSGQSGRITSIYASTATAGDVTAVTTAVTRAIPGSHVATQADLASKMTGTLASAGAVSTSIGSWISVAAFAAATLIAALLTMIGVTRRSREFGTLKALGWTSGRVVMQVVGESLVHGVIGAAAGIALAGIPAGIVNVLAPQLTAGLSSGGATTSIPLMLGVPIGAALAAAALAIASALVAAAFGASRVARLRPAQALRSAQ